MLDRSEVGASGSTWLAGGALSIVLCQSSVLCPTPSNTMFATLWIWVPHVSAARGITVKTTLPSPSGGVTLGGRNPASGSVGGWPVTGSIELKYHVMRPENGSTLAPTSPRPRG